MYFLISICIAALISLVYILSLRRFIRTAPSLYWKLVLQGAFGAVVLYVHTYFAYEALRASMSFESNILDVPLILALPSALAYAWVLTTLMVILLHMDSRWWK